MFLRAKYMIAAAMSLGLSFRKKQAPRDINKSLKLKVSVVSALVSSVFNYTMFSG